MKRRDLPGPRAASDGVGLAARHNKTDQVGQRAGATGRADMGGGGASPMARCSTQS
jgi:hypothetical protein